MTRVNRAARHVVAVATPFLSAAKRAGRRSFMGRTQRAALLSLALAALFASSGGQAQTTPKDALPFSKSYLITGNYAVGGVDLPNGGGSNGFVTGTIPMKDVPLNADILAAFLYWETITNSPTIKQQADGVLFRGSPVTVVKATTVQQTPATAACFSAGAQSRLTTFRADVLSLLPNQLDATGKKTDQKLVNDADLIKAGLPLNTVKLPDAVSSGNFAPVSAGASLFIVYRDPTQPLTQVVLYDGAYLQPPNVVMTQKLRGFWQSSTTHVAKMTQIVGSGKHNKTDRVWLDSKRPNTRPTLIGGDKFVNAGQGGNSDRGWSSPTFDVTSQMPGYDPAPTGGGFGEEVLTTVDHSNQNQYDCLTWSAIAFSATVKDDDADGIPDRMEDYSGLRQPNNEPLPDFKGMGASSKHKDIFVEVGATTAAPGTTYGSPSAPLNAATPQVTDVVGHSHLPSPDVLKLVGDAYRDAPVAKGSRENNTYRFLRGEMV